MTIASPVTENLETLGKLRIPQSLLTKRISSNIFHADDSIAAKLNQHLGEALTLREEHLGRHDGNTEALSDVDILKESDAPPTPASVFRGENLESSSTIVSRIKFVADRRRRVRQG